MATILSAFCSLTRPSRKNAAQLDDLTLPLYDQVNADSLRYVAAALSECRRVVVRKTRASTSVMIMLSPSHFVICEAGFAAGPDCL